MSIITAAAARDHLNLGSGSTDQQLAPLIAAAEQALADFLGRPLSGGKWPDGDEVPANVVHAAKLILADVFDDRNTPVQDMISVRHLCGRYIITSFA
ncbi:head-tail connector protein [uncultured Sphingomonas sp.]|uniref:head-tail connector protein n=1 Tax=uncultured Sphingomonas sp. TaxID=158754 RepID=UPI0025EF244E|nr:head-tail connector protein [uncultured Sphingomonas sp.]